MPSERLDVTVVLPCLDEEDSVGFCVDEALEAIKGRGWTGEVIVVDNGSRDASPEIAAARGARVIFEAERGYGCAVRAGIEAARGEIVVMADADKSYDLSKLPLVVEPVMRGEADIVFGGRLNEATRKTMPLLHRWIGTPVLTFLISRACGGPIVPDSQSGYRAFRKSTAVGLGLTARGMELTSEMLIRGVRAGLRFTEVPCGYRPRLGESKLNTFSDGWRNLQVISLLAPHLLLIAPGAVLFATGLGLAIAGLFAPGGIVIGSTQWQPVFFSSIALVLGFYALLAGMILANRSAIVAPDVRRRFAFVGDRSFPKRCGYAGLASAAVGLALDVFLFVAWLGDGRSSENALALAGIAQSLIIVGGSLMSFGLIGGLLRAGAEIDRQRLGVVEGRVIVLADSARPSGVPAKDQDADVATLRE